MRQPVALIPAYNPTAAMLAVVEQLLDANRFAAIYVVDDGSHSDCAELFDALKARGVMVLRHHVNLGKGMALRTGLNVIAAAHPEAPGVVTFDADGQHVAADIARVADRLVEDADALILGVRTLPADAPWRSRFGNALTRKVLSFFTGTKLSDTQTGLRGIPMDLIPDLLRLKSVGYDFELDMLIVVHRQCRRICEVPIEAVYIDDNAASHFNPILDSMKIYFVFLRFSSVSLMTAGIDYVVFAMAFLASRHILLAILLARCVAASFQFIMSYSFVFKTHQNRARAILKYLTVLVALTLLAYTGIHIFDTVLGISPLVSKVIVEGSIFIVSFLLLRDFVFAPQDSE